MRQCQWSAGCRLPGGSPRGLLQAKKHLFLNLRTSLHCPNVSFGSVSSYFFGPSLSGPLERNWRWKEEWKIGGATATANHSSLPLTHAYPFLETPSPCPVQPPPLPLQTDWCRPQAPLCWQPSCTHRWNTPSGRPFSLSWMEHLPNQQNREKEDSAVNYVLVNRCELCEFLV